MSTHVKKILSIVVIALLIVHFGFVFLYTSPLVIKGKLKTAATVYCYPFFYQTWELFAPVPTVTYHLYVRHQNNTHFTEWKDVFTEEQTKHRANRLKGIENNVLLFSNSLNYAVDTHQKTSQLKHNTTTTNEAILLYEVNQYLKLKACLKPNTVYDCIMYAKTSNGQVATYFINNTIK